MMEVVSKISVAEAILLFVLLFILPVMALLVQRLRRYEAAFGPPPERAGKAGTGKREEAPIPAEASASPAGAASASAPSYRARTFLGPADRACLAAMREVLGSDVDVFPKVALCEVVEAADAGGLGGKAFDFLVCDARTGKPLTGVAYTPGKGRPAGPVDELRNICASAGTNLVLLEMAEKYDAKTLREALGLPDLDLE